MDHPFLRLMFFVTIWLFVWIKCYQKWEARPSHHTLWWAFAAVLPITFWMFFVQLVRMQPALLDAFGRWGSLLEMNAIVLLLLVMFVYFLPLWFFFLLTRIGQMHVLHPNEARWMTGLHLVLLLSLWLTLALHPVAAATAITTPHGRTVGMSGLIWNPWLDHLARGALLLFPYSWTIWVQRQRIDMPTAVLQLLVVAWGVYWQSSATLPDVCDYSNPIVKGIAACG